MGEQAHEKGTSVVGGRWRKEAAETKGTPRIKNAQGSARGQCPVSFYEADGGRRAQQEGAAGGREEKTTGTQKRRLSKRRQQSLKSDPVKNLNR